MFGMVLPLHGLYMLESRARARFVRLNLPAPGGVAAGGGEMSSSSKAAAMVQPVGIRV
jgi:hypothetical protein